MESGPKTIVEIVRGNAIRIFT